MAQEPEKTEYELELKRSTDGQAADSSQSNSPSKAVQFGGSGGDVYELKTESLTIEKEVGQEKVDLSAADLELSKDSVDAEHLPEHKPWEGGSRKRALPALMLILLVATMSFWPFPSGRYESSTTESQMVGMVTDTLKWRFSEAGPRGLSFKQMDLRQAAETVSDQPPLFGWLGQCSWYLLDGDRLALKTVSEAGTADLTQRVRLAMRLVSVIGAYLLILSIFWLGHTLNGTLHGLVAAIVVISLPGLSVLGALPFAYALTLGLAALSLSSAIWAIRPYRPLSGTERQFLGWLLCGLTLGLVTLSGGVSGVISIIVPLVILIMLAPNRKGHLLGLVAAVAMAFLMCVPWLIHAHEADPEAWRNWLGLNMDAEPTGSHLLWHLAGHWRIGELSVLSDPFLQFLLLMMLWVFPWGGWCLLAIVFELTPAAEEIRKKHLITIIWFILLMTWGGWMLMTGLLLMLVIPFSILVATFTISISDLNRMGRFAVVWQILRWGQPIVIVSASLLLLLLSLMHGSLNRMTSPGLLADGHLLQRAWNRTYLLVLRISEQIDAAQLSWLWHATSIVICLAASALVIFLAKKKQLLGIFFVSSLWLMYVSRFYLMLMMS